MSENQQETQAEQPTGAKKPLNEFLRHQQRAVEETGRALEELLPLGFRNHSREAGREFISGMKVLFDAAIDGVQQASKDFDKNFNRPRPTGSDSDDKPSSTGTTKVKVQVE